MADSACRFTAAKSDLHDKVVALGEQNLSNFIFGYLPDTRVANGMRVRYKVWIALKAFSRSIPDITNLVLLEFMFTRGEWDGALVAWHVWVRQRYETAEAELLGQRMEAVTKIRRRDSRMSDDATRMNTGRGHESEMKHKPPSLA
jgi:hypothetical protein